MRCPYCSSEETRVLDKRESIPGIVRRRRECLKCQKRFTTYEKIEALDLYVIKKDGRREPFNREKLMNGILKACEKRPISHDTIEKTVSSIEAELLNKKKKEVSSREIGEMVMKMLKKLDKVAYIRFASVYREFKDLSSFEEELSKLKGKKRKEKNK
ncbi:MAG: transcriptional regulator NrdR [Candidatus Woesearchaeota archaeon]|nr:transcriptional regulator NrdR [Candidatus Woesearchaeota archaeon]